jgi:hypothetical protein
MLPDAILAAWRTWLIWCQINQTRSVLLMEQYSEPTDERKNARIAPPTVKYLMVSAEGPVDEGFRRRTPEKIRERQKLRQA